MALVGLSIVARADQSRDAARNFYKSALTHYNLREYAEALSDFREAYRRVPDPSLLFNIAQCHRQLGDPQSAISFYRGYLREVPNAPNREEVERLIATSERIEPRPQKPPESPMEAAKPSPAPVPAPLTTSARLPERRPTPLVRRWWLWTIVGGVAVAGVAIGLGVGLAPAPGYPTRSSTDGTFRF